MSDESSVPTQSEHEAARIAAGPEASAPELSAGEGVPAGQSAGEAWSDVVARLGELGDAISAWAKAAADTPENRKHLDDVRTGLDEVAQRANEAFSNVASGDFGRQVSDSATQMGTAIGSTAQEIGQAAAPAVASAFAGLADAFGRAAEKVGEAAAPRTAEPHDRPAPEPPAAATPRPATPASPAGPPDDERE
jgi:hypothetical protein